MTPQYALHSELERIERDYGERLVAVETKRSNDSERLIRIEQSQDRASTRQYTTMVLVIITLVGMLFQLMTGHAAEHNPARAAVEAAHE